MTDSDSPPPFDRVPLGPPPLPPRVEALPKVEDLPPLPAMPPPRMKVDPPAPKPAVKPEPTVAPTPVVTTPAPKPRPMADTARDLFGPSRKVGVAMVATASLVAGIGGVYLTGRKPTEPPPMAAAEKQPATPTPATGSPPPPPIPPDKKTASENQIASPPVHLPPIPLGDPPGAEVRSAAFDPAAPAASSGTAAIVLPGAPLPAAPFGDLPPTNLSGDIMPVAGQSPPVAPSPAAPVKVELPAPTLPTAPPAPATPATEKAKDPPASTPAERAKDPSASSPGGAIVLPPFGLPAAQPPAETKQPLTLDVKPAQPKTDAVTLPAPPAKPDPAPIELPKPGGFTPPPSLDATPKASPPAAMLGGARLADPTPPATPVAEPAAPAVPTANSIFREDKPAAAPTPLPTPPPAGATEPLALPPVNRSPAPVLAAPTGPTGVSLVKPAGATDVRTDFDVDLHDPKASDTYDSISKLYYGDTRYAAALRSYNRNQPLGGGRSVEVPPLAELRKRAGTVR